MTIDQQRRRRSSEYVTLRRRSVGCDDGQQHHFVVLGQPGLRSPVCVHCGVPWFRHLTDEEWGRYESYWRETRYVVFRDEFTLGRHISLTDNRHVWAAGFLDGEGCFQAHMASSGRLLIDLSASQVDKRPLLILQSLYAGGCRKVLNPRENQRDHWSWNIQSARQLRVVLPVLIPHLIVKREQAEALLDLCALVGGKGRHSLIREVGNQKQRLHLLAQLKSLKRM